MTHTVLITGCSSGIGRSCVTTFEAAGWHVLATARTQESIADLASDNVRVAQLDVTDSSSITAALTLARDEFGELDCIVNNAGYGLVGPFEGTSTEDVERQMATNVRGVMEVTRAALPLLRERAEHRGKATIINIASMGGRLTVPLYSVYHASKWAVEGFSESLQYELRPLGIRVRIIEPGPIATDFYGRSMDDSVATSPKVYQAWSRTMLDRMNETGTAGAPAAAVAKTVVRAATVDSWKLRWQPDGTGRRLLRLRRILPVRTFMRLVAMQTGARKPMRD